MTWRTVLERTNRRWTLAAPFWMLFLGTLALTAGLWRLDRRRLAPGVCVCGYNLTGNISGRCPECGTPVNELTAKPRSDIP